jgi:hypothetical protein
MGEVIPEIGEAEFLRVAAGSEESISVEDDLSLDIQVQVREAEELTHGHNIADLEVNHFLAAARTLEFERLEQGNKRGELGREELPGVRQ